MTDKDVARMADCIEQLETAAMYCKGGRDLVLCLLMVRILMIGDKIHEAPLALIPIVKGLHNDLNAMKSSDDPRAQDLRLAAMLSSIKGVTLSNDSTKQE